MDMFASSSATQQYAGGKMLATKAEGVGIMTFNQPEKRNAMSVEMWQGVAEILGAWEKDDEVRSVIMTGAGDKAFVSGADISQFAKLRNSADSTKEYERMTGVGRQALANFPKPVIARIRGYCMGGGLAIAMRADMRISAEDGIFGIPAARMSIAYGFDQVGNLVDLVGPAHASMILFTARKLDARYAERIGLVNECVPADKLDETVLEIARTIADNAPLSIAASKMSIAACLQDKTDRNMERIREQARICADSNDFREGRTAFMEKRRPKFPGR